MRTKILVSLLCGLFLGLGEAMRPETGPLAAAEQTEAGVTVDVASGRSFAGEVDSRTDEAHLWLRRRLGSGFVRRPIDWDRVVRVQLAGESFSAHEFRQSVHAVRQTAGEPEQPEEGGSRIVLGPWEQSPGPQSASARGAAAAQRPPRVRSLAIDVRVGEWDNDVDVDGLVLDVYPLDAAGEMVPVNGTLEVNLTVENTGVPRHGHWSPFEQMGRWTRRVRLADFGPFGARYRLPFQAVHPEFDLQWASYGVVRVRLGVPASSSGPTAWSGSGRTARFATSWSRTREDVFSSRNERAAAARATSAHSGLVMAKLWRMRTEPSDNRAQPSHSGGLIVLAGSVAWDPVIALPAPVTAAAGWLVCSARKAVHFGVSTTESVK